jgi:hypothetical protein
VENIRPRIERALNQTAQTPKPAPSRAPAASPSTPAMPHFAGRWRLASDPDCRQPRVITIDGDSLTMQIGNVTIVEVIVRRDKKSNGLVTYAPNLDASYEFVPLRNNRLRMTALKQDTSETWIRCG